MPPEQPAPIPVSRGSTTTYWVYDYLLGGKDNYDEGDCPISGLFGGAPVAIVLAAVLRHVPDEDSPHKLAGMLMTAVAPGSYLVISHATASVPACIG